MARDIHNILFGIFSNNIPRPATQADTLPLPNRVKPETIMFAHDGFRFNLNQITLLNTYMRSYKIRKVNFSQKANTLAIFTIFVNQIKFMSQCPYFGLSVMSYRKNRLSKLF